MLDKNRTRKLHYIQYRRVGGGITKMIYDPISTGGNIFHKDDVGFSKLQSQLSLNHKNG